jgi:aminomethyltransferase
MSLSTALKTTPLHSEHVRLGARMVGFGGWDMPVQYSGIRAEHLAVRNALGVFDISHMGQCFVSGAASEGWLNGLLTNNVQRLAPSQGHYTFLLNEQGGVIDDLIIYRMAQDRWLLILNASKVEEDVAWLRAHLGQGVSLEDASAERAGLAVQGPRAEEWLKSFLKGAAAIPQRNSMVEATVDAVALIIARTGYTGEDGFEIFCPGDQAVKVFQSVLETGKAFEMVPAGLGARDTLRLEMGYPLNGNDLSPEGTPLEAGLGFFVDLNKSFTGSEVLKQQKAEGVKRRLVGFKMVGKTPPPRSHYPVWLNGEQVGETCSGGLSPSLDLGIGLAYLPAASASVGTAIEIQVRETRYPAVIEKKPFYKNGSAK